MTFTFIRGRDYAIGFAVEISVSEKRHENDLCVSVASEVAFVNNPPSEKLSG
jgi:hypothetical protein